MKVLGFLIIVVALFALGWAADTALGWVAIEAVGGHDISFREAAGVGLLLVVASASGSVNNN